jgi:hypothetical protein
MEHQQQTNTEAMKSGDEETNQVELKGGNPSSTIILNLYYHLYKEQQTSDPSDWPYYYKITPRELIPAWTVSLVNTSFADFKEQAFTHVTASPKIQRLLKMADCSGELNIYCATEGQSPLGVLCPRHQIHHCPFPVFVSAAIKEPQRQYTILLSMNAVGKPCVGVRTMS